jgi:hypothetical protein
MCEYWNSRVLAAWNNWNIDIPPSTLSLGIIFQLWNNLSTVRNIPDKKLFLSLWRLQHASGPLLEA